MARRSDAEQRLLDKARRYLPGGSGGNLVLPEDLDFLVSSGKGSHVFDVSGNEYVDWLMGSGPMALGIPPLLGMAWGYSTEAGWVRLIMA